MTDLRSDTFTKPSEAMLLAMMQAKVGDDVFGEDPTINELEDYARNMFGMEAALFCPSGTMTNQIGIKCHTRPGDEVICEASSHVYIYEGGGIASNSGSQVKAIQGDRGRITAPQVEESINPDDIHKAVSRLVVLENTANRGGGSIYKIIDIQDIKTICLKHDLKLHLDGARLFNALSQTGETTLQYGELFDSISICLSKGLGAPIGSLLLGDFEFIRQARRVRKVFGGGMRQAGYLAAAGLFALQNNIERLQVDHIHAKQVAEALLTKDFVGKMLPVETNIIIFELIGHYTAASFCEYMKKYEVLCLPISATQVRMVFHLDVVNEMVNRLIQLIHTME
ncbi:threonine aldolase [Ferruginibacter sp. HRS2-29]|nr:threonine aldolase [Ferruginibacter sp. HRS2-29]